MVPCLHPNHSLRYNMLDNKKGVSLIEVVVYIAVFAILVPTITIFYLTIRQNTAQTIDIQTVDNATAIAMNQLETEIKSASKIVATQSILEQDAGKIVFKDNSGSTISFAYLEELVNINGSEHIIGRIARIENAKTQWLTSATVDVNQFKIRLIQDSTGLMTSLNIDLSVQSIGNENFKELSLSTSFAFYPFTTEE